MRAISKYKPPGAYTWRGDFDEGFFALQVWGAYAWRGLFSEFYGNYSPPRPIAVPAFLSKCVRAI